MRSSALDALQQLPPGEQGAALRNLIVTHFHPFFVPPGNQG